MSRLRDLRKERGIYAGESADALGTSMDYLAGRTDQKEPYPKAENKQ